MKRSEFRKGQIQDLKDQIIKDLADLYQAKSNPMSNILELDKHVEVVENDDTVELNHTITAISENSVFLGSPYFDTNPHLFTEFDVEFLVKILDAVEETV